MLDNTKITMALAESVINHLEQSFNLTFIYQESPLLYFHSSLWYLKKERLGGSVVPGAGAPCHFSLCNYHHSTVHPVQHLRLRTTNYMISIKHEKWDLGGFS